MIMTFSVVMAYELPISLSQLERCTTLFVLLDNGTLETLREHRSYRKVSLRQRLAHWRFLITGNAMNTERKVVDYRHGNLTVRWNTQLKYSNSGLLRSLLLALKRESSTIKATTAVIELSVTP